MSRNNGQKVRLVVAIPALIAVGSAAAIAGVTVQGVTVQGVTVQGVTVQGVTVQGVTVQGVTVQGVTVQGVTVQGVTVQGVTVQGVTVQGVTVQGVATQGVTVQGNSLMGTDLLASDFDGVNMTSVDIRGTTAASGTQTYTLTRVPGMSTGNGNYIALASGSAAGHYATAHFTNVSGMTAQDLDLFIAADQPDPMPNLFHNFDEQDNHDQLYIVYYFNKWSGEWISLCPYNPLTKSASAVALAEDSGSPNQFFFACTATGVASKCARNWGYRPWADTTAYEFNSGLGTWALKTFPLKPYYDSCKIAAMANYCQNGTSFTKTGTQVDLFDTQQIVWPNTIENPWNALNPTSLWMNAQEFFVAQDLVDPPFDATMHKSALQRSRYQELSPISECADFGAVDRLDHDHIEDGRWGALFKDIGTINVFSPTYCKHDEYTPGDALPWDCSPCTTQVCKTHPECCGSMGVPNAWTPACAGYAGASCNDAGGQWAPGKVWPKDASNDDKSIYPTFLLGPAGAVLRADGVSGAGTSATIAGWACDPEWPGASVAVQIYAGGTADGGGTLLGTVRADQALATPLADEVSAACDGPGLTHARHGFSYTLPNNQTGDVWVYAVDESTANGPAAPPTLLRNGVVQVPRCAHSEHVSGDALAASCSACAGSVCGDGTHGDCCTTAWTDDCAAAADSCAPADASVLFNSRSFAATTTGWIEAPATGTYTFQASQLPSRLFINGTTVLDWFTTSPGTTSGSIDLLGGHRYAFRWDRLQAEPLSGTPGQGLTWQPPGTIGQTTIPSTNLYAVAPNGTSGLSATFYTGANPNGFTGATITRNDPNIDINKDVAPPGPTPLDLPSGFGPSYSAIWEGEIIPSFSESYNFYVVGGGEAHLYINGSEVSLPGPAASNSPPQGACAHDLCATGDKLDAACNSCAATICAPDHDPFCCNGGYLSYYSYLPEWDARCMAEVANYCAPYQCTPPDPGPPITPQKKSVGVPLLAGVHYPIRLTYDNPTNDKTIRLMWVSPRQGRQPVAQYAFQPPAAPANAGSGLNVTYFATKSQNGNVIADGAAVATGMVPDLSLAPAIGQLGTPLVDVLATPVDAVSGQPAMPSVTRPRNGEEVFVDGSGIVHITGIGGISSGTVRITGGTAGDVLATVDGNGDFAADVPLALGPQTLKLTQQSTAATPCAAPGCFASKDLAWPVTVTLATASPKAPQIITPKDPTHTPTAAPLTLSVVGNGTSGAVHVTDLGSEPSANPDIPANPDGSFTGSVTLDFGTPSDPNKGWHKLVFDQGGAQSPPVFVSVGIDPPTVVFPRNGAEIDCNQADPQGDQIAIGTLPYPQTGDHSFGRLRVMEETGRKGLAFVGAETQVPQPQPGQPIVFLTHFNPGPGRHVIYFFQAPDPPQQATQDQIDEHYRAYSRVADTPFSKIVVERKPPRFPIIAGSARLLRPKQPFTIGSTQDCVPGQSPPDSGCAQPLADVNLRVGPRLYTTRADATGGWSFTLFDLPPHGWSDVTLAQVLDSNVGGAWSESCESNTIEVGYESLGDTVIQTPPDITVDATSAAGATVSYDVSAADANGNSVPVTCLPASGSTFPITTTFVHCTATNTATGDVAIGGFRVTVVAGPPTISASNVTLEATGPAGATLNAYNNVVVTDVVDPSPTLVCTPAAPNLFLLDHTMPVSCTATDDRNHSASTQFNVRVQDTTPPTACAMPDLQSGTNSGAGAIVTFTPCNATDIVDGSVPMVCDHASGSFFPVGTTTVTCVATDQHGNPSAHSTFNVSVGDTTPPVLRLPSNVTAFATSSSGAHVSYTATATDNVDPHPTVVCAPSSGALFHLGTTPVNCTATDAAGNTSTGAFTVRVIVSWGGFLPPVNQDGSSRFILGLPIALRYVLTGASANICDLSSRLFVAPLDANGNPGTERPAAGLPPGAGNLFYFIPIINQYAMLLDTRPLSLGPWRLRVDLGDGEVHTQRITLVRF